MKLNVQNEVQPEWQTFPLPWIKSGWNRATAHAIHMLKRCWASNHCAQGEEGKKLHGRKFCSTVYTMGLIFIILPPMALQECELGRAKGYTACSRGCQRHRESFHWLRRALAWTCVINANYMAWLKKQEGWEYNELRQRDVGFWYFGRWWRVFHICKSSCQDSVLQTQWYLALHEGCEFCVQLHAQLQLA